MHTVTKSDVVIVAIALQDESKERSQSLSYILSQMWFGSALTLVMSCEAGNGLEQWRRLGRSEELDSGAARVAQL